MKSYPIAIIFLLTCVSSSYGQPRWSPGKRAKIEIRWMQDSLHLTDEQVKKVTPIITDYEYKLDKVAQKREKTKARKIVYGRADAKMKTVLNKEQFRAYSKRENQIRRQEQRPASGPNQPL